MFKNIQDFIQLLEQQNELVRITEFVDPKLEMAEIVDRISKTPSQNKALLFENTGTEFPVLINALGSYERMCLALGVDDMDDIAKEIEDLFESLTAPKQGVLEKIKMLPQLGQIGSWMPKESNRKGACQEVIMENPDVTKLPVMTCWPEDGGPFLTLPVIHTQHPINKSRNVGLYRMQVFEPTLTGMHWHKHKVSAGHFNEYKKLGIKMPVSVSLGGDPVYTYAGTAPLPPNVDEYILAGFLRKKKVELVKCITNDLYVPADADFVIEGYVDPEEELIWEGPFGDHTGYYSLADWYPRFHITAITHKKNAVYPSTIVGIPPQEDAWIGKATERIFLAPIKMTMLPEVLDMELPIEGVFHNLTIVKIEKEFAGHAAKVMNAMWGAGQMMFNKILVVVDQHVNIQNYQEVAQVISKNVDPERDIYLSQGPMDVLDHSCSAFAFGGKMCLDATTKMEEELRSTTISNASNQQRIDAGYLKQAFPEIVGFNDQLVEQGISMAFVAVKKSRRHHVRELHAQLCDRSELAHIKMFFYIEEVADVMEIKDAIWRWSNNIDPKRDTFIAHAADNNSISRVGFDGTRKTKEHDDFHRDWPNIICSDDQTIQSVDEKWDNLNIGPFIPSPSLKYRDQIYNEGAIANE